MAIVETSEKETGLLQTHYFKASYDQLKAYYLELLKTSGLRVISIDDNYHEIFAEAPHITVTAKIIEQTPKETSIDFYISAEYLLGSRKKAYAFIGSVYKEMEKKFELKGLGLHQ